MARKANPDRVQQAAGLVAALPGRRAAEYARWIGCPRETFNRLLTQMDDLGFLLWEDDQGRLWPFEDAMHK